VQEYVVEWLKKAGFTAALRNLRLALCRKKVLLLREQGVHVLHRA
jgi:hypothetical protein